MGKIGDWIKAMRLRTLPLALATSITGGAMAWQRAPDFWEIFGLIITTTLLLQILSNLANDYGDFVKGTDNEERIGPERALQSKAISPGAMKIALIVLGILSLGSGILLLNTAFEDAFANEWFWIMLGVGLIAIWAAVKYTVGDTAYGYRGLGDVFVFLFFGLVGVYGTYFLITKSLDYTPLLPAIAIGCFATAVLNLNNMRDHKNDFASGKKTLVVKVGIDNAKTYHATLIFAGWACITGLFMTINSSPVQLLIFLPAFIFIRNVKLVLGTENVAEFDPELKKIALGTFALSILLFVVQFIVL